MWTIACSQRSVQLTELCTGAETKTASHSRAAKSFAETIKSRSLLSQNRTIMLGSLRLSARIKTVPDRINYGLCFANRVSGSQFGFLVDADCSRSRHTGWLRRVCNLAGV